MAQSRSSFLNPPMPARKALSFAAAKPRAVSEWVSQLPKVNLTETSRKLYLAIREINELKISPADRIELLDILADSIAEASDGLFRKHLEQPFALNELERKVVNLAQGLSTELATGYKAAAVAATDATWGLSKRDTAARGLHHCLWALLPVLWRSHSLYLPPPKRLWAEMHDLYRRAQKNGTAAEVFARGAHSGSLNQSYKCALLFSIAQPFQLQRQEHTVLFGACLAWAEVARLRPAEESGIYLVDLNLDLGPVYRTENSVIHPDSLGLNTDDLVARLSGNPDQTLPPVRGLTPRLQEHLAIAWDRAQPRRFRRKPAEESVNITLGLSAVHSQLCNNKAFDTFLQDYEPNAAVRDASETRFLARDTVELQRSKDVWEYSFDAGGNQLPDIPTKGADLDIKPLEDDYIDVPVFNAHTLDLSPRGYCLRWTDRIPPALIMGEVVSIKPAKSAHWTVGLLRWLRQSNGMELHLGVELLSPKAEACAARILNKTGQHSGFLRAIVLPEIAAVAQPESILLPRLKAQAGQKILLSRRGENVTYRLVKKITETSAVGQFSIQRVSRPDSKQGTAPGSVPDLQNDPLWREF